MPARRQEGVPAIPTAKERAFAKLMSLCRRVAAFGADVVACGVFQPLSGPDLPLTFAPKRQGKAESAYRRPRLRPSFGQPKGIGRPIPYKKVTTGLFPTDERSKNRVKLA